METMRGRARRDEMLVSRGSQCVLCMGLFHTPCNKRFCSLQRTMQRLYNAGALCNANVTTALCLSPNPVDPGSTVFYFVPPGDTPVTIARASYCTMEHTPNSSIIESRGWPAVERSPTAIVVCSLGSYEEENVSPSNVLH